MHRHCIIEMRWTTEEEELTLLRQQITIETHLPNSKMMINRSITQSIALSRIKTHATSQGRKSSVCLPNTCNISRIQAGFLELLQEFQCPSTTTTLHLLCILIIRIKRTIPSRMEFITFLIKQLWGRAMSKSISQDLATPTWLNTWLLVKLLQRITRWEFSSRNGSSICSSSNLHLSVLLQLQSH